MLDLLFGSVDKNAERELANYKPGRGREKDIGDHLGDFITGRGNAIDRAVEDQYVEALKRENQIALDDLRGTPGLNLPTITKDTDEQVLNQQINSALNKKTKYDNAVMYAAKNNITLDPTKYTDPTGIIAETNRRVQERDNKKESTAKFEAQQRYDTEREDRITRERENDRRYYQERTDNLEFKRDQLMFQKTEAMRADARLAQDRKDKAIAILMSGLGNLGEAFAGMTV